MTVQPPTLVMLNGPVENWISMRTGSRNFRSWVTTFLHAVFAAFLLSLRSQQRGWEIVSQLLAGVKLGCGLGAHRLLHDAAIIEFEAHRREQSRNKNFPLAGLLRAHHFDRWYARSRTQRACARCLVSD
jgi:hypothetical protein